MANRLQISLDVVAIGLTVSKLEPLIGIHLPEDSLIDGSIDQQNRDTCLGERIDIGRFETDLPVGSKHEENSVLGGLLLADVVFEAEQSLVAAHLVPVQGDRLFSELWFD